jgi:uncharacterized RDD family membrane protein YckC
VFPTDERPALTVPSGLVLASIGRRALGTILDQLLVLVPVAIGVVISGFRPGDDLTDDTLLWLNAISVGLAFVYELLMIGFLGRTVGKFATGTRVVSQVDGSRIGWFGAAQRAVVPAVAAAIPAWGFLLGSIVYGLALLGPLRQGLHDRAAGTLVVMAR